MTNPEMLRAAREEAERALDGLLDVAREEMDGIPTEGRFKLMLASIARLDPSQALLAAVAVVAVERILMRERLDFELSDGSQA